MQLAGLALLLLPHCFLLVGWFLPLTALHQRSSQSGIASPEKALGPWFLSWLYNARQQIQLALDGNFPWTEETSPLGRRLGCRDFYLFFLLAWRHIYFILVLVYNLKGNSAHKHLVPWWEPVYWNNLFLASYSTLWKDNVSFQIAKLTLP